MTQIINLDKFRVTKTRTNKVLELLKEYSNKNIPLDIFCENTNFISFSQTSKIIEKVKSQYSKELNKNVVEVISYLKNLNNSHNIFYNGFKLSLAHEEGLNLQNEDFFKPFEELGINSIFVEYRPNKDKKSDITTSKE